MFTSAEAWRGSGVSFTHIANGLRAAGHRVVMLATHPEVTAGFRAAGLDARELRFRKTGIAEALSLRALLRETASRVVMTDRPRDLRLAALACMTSNVSIVHRYNLSRAEAPRDVITRVAYRGAVRETVFLTTTALDKVRAATPFVTRRRSRVIPEGVDVNLFQRDLSSGAAFRHVQQLGDEPFVLAVGALSPEKRYDVLLAGLHRLGDSAPLLVIAGSGPEELRIRASAAKLRVRVRLLGLVEQTALVGAYTSALCLIHACEVETFGLGVAEAMATECAVVVPNGGALPDVVGSDGQCGLVVPPRDDAALGDAMNTLLGDKARRLRMGVAARERIATRYSLTAMQDAYVSVIREAAR